MPRNGPLNRPRRRLKPKPPSKRDPLAHLPLIAYMNAHLEWMQVTGYTEQTVRTFREGDRRFIAWCDERGLTLPADITRQVLERYQRHLFYYRKPDGKPLSIGRQRGCLNPLVSFFKWLARENHILYSPAADLELPRIGRRLPRVILSVEEVEAILMQPDAGNPSGLRDRALLEVLYSTGLRRTEAANLSIYDIDFIRRVVMVREGKGRKDRVVPIGARALAWTDKYLLQARPLLLAADTDALFINSYGEPAPPDFIAERVRLHKDNAGITKPGSTHLLRHACATHMLEGGADIRFLQAMLGHASLESTEIYTHVAIDKLQAIHEATHPARLHRQPEAAQPTENDRHVLDALLAADKAA